MSFSQCCGQGKGSTTYVAGSNGAVYPNIRCYQCKKFGNYLDQFPEDNGKENNNKNANEEGITVDVNGANALQIRVQCKQGTQKLFKLTWMLLYM